MQCAHVNYDKQNKKIIPTPTTTTIVQDI